MKNLHLISTDKPSRLFYNKKDSIFTIDNDFEYVIKEDWFQDYNIYITSDEEIEEGDWFYDLGTKYIKIKQSWENSHLDFNGKKIILTTDQDFIQDGVQAIEDEFLEWFVKNPSCEEVEIYSLGVTNQLTGESGHYKYEIIIPKEEPTEEAKQRAENYMSLKGALEPKQETLEEAALKYASKKLDRLIIPYKELDANVAEYVGFTNGAKWQQKRMYSEEDLISFYNFIENHQLRKYGDIWKRITNDSKDKPLNFESVDDQYIIEWFEQFKKK